jgi:ABC-type phosphate/phosphonate transport system substrate-binding protein
MPAPVRVGAVLYAPRVSVIWDIIRDYFDSNGCPMDVALYRDYGLQVEALVRGDLDIAWNSPLAWLESQRLSGGACRAIAMRDTDRDRVSQIVVDRRRGITSIGGLRGRRLAVGAADSPQATLIPLGMMARNGMMPGTDYRVIRHDRLEGLHGDHVGGEIDALRALQQGEADASAMLDLNWQQWTRDGTANPDQLMILATTERYDHCVFTARQDFPHAEEQAWLKVLFSMSYDNPQHREMMDLEGLRKWLPGRTSGFGPLAEAVKTVRLP